MKYFWPPKQKQKNLPGLIKSDKPKSVAFKGESNAFDLKRKFCKQGRNVMLQQ